MKKTFVSGLFITLALCFVFTACSGIGEKNTESKDSYVASGKIELNGAAPAINVPFANALTPFFAPRPSLLAQRFPLLVVPYFFAILCA